MNKLIGQLWIVWAFSVGVMAEVSAESEAEAPVKIEMTDLIKGNHQHPNVLFIVPWQAPIASIPAAHNMAIRLPDELLNPIERAYFVEQYVGVKEISQ
jgi:hypothetical protein